MLLSVTNVPEEWSTDAAFKAAMAEFGDVERAGIVTNAAGVTKGYGLVEYRLPSAAKTAKDKLDEITVRAGGSSDWQPASQTALQHFRSLLTSENRISENGIDIQHATHWRRLQGSPFIIRAQAALSL